MEYRKLLILAEIWSLITFGLIFFKTLILTPGCFDLLDNYLIVLPLILISMLKFNQLKR